LSQLLSKVTVTSSSFYIKCEDDGDLGAELLVRESGSISPWKLNTYADVTVNFARLNTRQSQLDCYTYICQWGRILSFPLAPPLGCFLPFTD